MNMSQLCWATTIAVCLGLLSMNVNAAEIQVSKSGAVVKATLLDPGIPDIANARPAPLPKTAQVPDLSLKPAAVSRAGKPGLVRGNEGSGKETPAFVGEPKTVSTLEVGSQEYGIPGHYEVSVPYTTARADAKGVNTTKYYPFRAAGKLFFEDSATGYTYVCSASLVKPGVVVTAAHCVAAYGQSRFYQNWVFVPAYRKGNAPYGVWFADSASVLGAYYAGTDNCAVAGIVCENDVAVLTLAPQLDETGAAFYAGHNTGWLSYGWDGYSFASGASLVTQLGYPVALDSGVLMERTDSLGMVDGSMSNNTVIGSLQTGGSSGGPWVANLGVKPKLSSSTYFGSDADANTVIGVTSWGYVDPAYKIQGASPFTRNNIVVLVNGTCAADPAVCAR